MPNFQEHQEVTVAGIEPSGVVFVRTVTVVTRDGEPFSRSAPHRAPLNPGADVSAYPAQIQAVCAAVWTPEVVAAWQAREASPQ